MSDIVPGVTAGTDSRFPRSAFSWHLNANVLFITADQWRGDCLERGRAPGRAHPAPRPARRRRRLVPAPFRPGRAVRAEPGGAVHGHVPDEPPVGPERHPARRPPRQRRPGRPPPRLRARAVRLHRHEHRPAHVRARRSPPVPVRRRAPRLRPGLPPPRGRAARLARVDARRRRRRAGRVAPVRRPSRGRHPLAHAVRRPRTRRRSSSPTASSIGRTARRSRRGVGSRTCRSCGRTRRSSRPRRTTRCSTRRRCPRRYAPRHAPRKARSTRSSAS